MATKTARKAKRTGKPKRPARKVARKTDMDRQLARARARAAPYELAELEHSDLPFIARRQPMISPTYDSPERHSGRFEWSVPACAIADAILLQGYRLLVRCPPDHVALATSAIARQLKTPVHVWWNNVHNVLIVGLMEEDQVQDEEDEEGQKD